MSSLGSFPVSCTLVKIQNKAVEKIFTRFFACKKWGKNLFTYLRWHVIMQFITWKVLLNRFYRMNFRKKPKMGESRKEPTFVYWVSEKNQRGNCERAALFYPYTVILSFDRDSRGRSDPEIPLNWTNINKLEFFGDRSSRNSVRSSPSQFLHNFML